MTTNPSPHFSKVRRRTGVWMILALGLSGLELVRPELGYAESSGLPASVQAELMGKLAGYDRNFAARAALEVKGALSRLSTVGALPHEEQVVNFSNAGALADAVRSRKAAIVYFGPGFDKQLPAIRGAFSSLDVLTIGSVPDYVPNGIVLGFDLVSGHPKLLINVDQAKKQQVSIPASVLKLMKVFP